jgi:hypothetical protein
MLGDHIRRCQQRDNALDAQGDELDGYRNEALEAMARIYGKADDRGRRPEQSSPRNRMRSPKTARAVSKEQPTEVQKLGDMLAQFMERMHGHSSPDKKSLKQDNMTDNPPAKLDM